MLFTTRCPYLIHNFKFRRLVKDGLGHKSLDESESASVIYSLSYIQIYSQNAELEEIGGNTYEIDPWKTIMENVQCHSNACGGAFEM